MISYVIYNNDATMPGSLIGSVTFLKTGLDPMGATERALQGRRERCSRTCECLKRMGDSQVSTWWLIGGLGLVVNRDSYGGVLMFTIIPM